MRARLGRGAPAAPWWLALAPALLLGGCGHDQLATRDVHHGPLALASVEDVPVCGHDAQVERRRGGAVAGELVSVTPDTITLIGEQGLEAVPVADAARVLVKVRPGRGGVIVGTTVVGALSTVSNGGFLILTFPAWIISGSAVAGIDGSRTYPAAEPTDSALASYARFPQGSPPGWPGAGGPPQRCLPSPTDPARAAQVDPAGQTWVKQEFPKPASEAPPALPDASSP